ncbi:response regulator [Jannaschia sp. S6380]|uniref:response regulator n=1 Tax=Jannaschia sp. S6380 TaxID=2926408 RepID=UPI001FF5FD76|nr:response regulator [Jannaschia sp. S6380]MCK0167567.1 response regulator [Jannaschia sp. S6380]
MLDDCNVMLVEDEALLALDLSLTLEDAGARVAGPFATVESALSACEDVDCAVLDVDLWDQKVYPVADRLMASRKPFLFHTGSGDRETLMRRYGRDIRMVEKPARRAEIVAEVASLIAKACR